MNMDSDEKLVLGSEEWCALPSLGIPAIKARVDSGAKTSSIHAFNISSFKRGGDLWVSFEVHPLQQDRRVVIRCEAPVVDRRGVKSSSGVSEKRYVIKAPFSIGEHTWEIEITLANRDSMGFRMLLGREAMADRVLVDPSGKVHCGQPNRIDLDKFYGEVVRETSGLRIGILASDPRLYSNRRLMEAGEERGHEMIFLNIKQCYMRLDDENPEIHYRGGLILNNLDAVIPRIRPSLTFYGCALTRHFENIGCYVLNAASAISESRDKLFSLQKLSRAGIDIPVSGFANSPVDTDDLIEMVGGAPVIVKLLEGTQGRGVVLAETRKAAESVVNAFKSLKANLLVQEFVKEAQGKDLRCFVINNKVVATIERTAAPGEFRANLHRGGSASLVKISPEEKAIAIKAARTMGLRVAGVDIIRSSKGPLLLEVNSSPGLEGVEEATGKDIASLMITAIEKKLKWQRSISSSLQGSPISL